MNYHESFRPRSQTKTGRVWDLADQISQKIGRRASRPEVIAAYVREGGNPGTASTQYSHWKASQHFSANITAVSGMPDASQKHRLRVGSDGTLMLPAELLAAMQLGPDGLVTAHMDDGELRILSRKLVLERVQQFVRERVTRTGSPVDELIAERRAEALQE